MIRQRSKQGPDFLVDKDGNKESAAGPHSKAAGLPTADFKRMRFTNSSAVSLRCERGLSAMNILPLALPPRGPPPPVDAFTASTSGSFRTMSANWSTFARIADELHHQYLLGFAPQKLDGKSHVLEVHVKREGLTVRARKSYVAPRG